MNSNKDINKEEGFVDNEANGVDEGITTESSKVEEGVNVEEEAKEPTLEDKYSELNDKYLRLYSEFENFRKRTIKEKADLIASANSSLIKDVLPVVDDFERAIVANEKVTDPDSLKEGFDLIFNKFFKILEGKGLKAMESTGKEFDTTFHEAITEFPAPKAKDKGKVIDTAEKGYLLNNKVVRFAKVVVGK